MALAPIGGPDIPVGKVNSEVDVEPLNRILEKDENQAWVNVGE